MCAVKISATRFAAAFAMFALMHDVHAVCYSNGMTWTDKVHITPIQKHFKESVITYGPNTIARSVLVATPRRYEQARDAVRAAVNSAFGIEFEQEERKHDNAADWPQYQTQFMKTRTAEEAITPLLKVGIDVRYFRQTVLHSKRYHVVPEIDGFSVLYARIIDAQDVMGLPGTLIFVTRKDYGRWWIISRALVPLRVYERGAEVITKTELTLLESAISVGTNKPVNRVVCPVLDVVRIGNFDDDRAALREVKELLEQAPR